MTENQIKAKSTLLRRNDTAILLVDHQVGLLSGVRDLPTATLVHNVVALAKAAKVLNIPVVMTAVESGGLWGPTLPELTAVLPDTPIIKRSAVSAWNDENVVKAVKATGKKQLLVAGISLEVCAALPALGAQADGYEVAVVIDACGTFNMEKRVAGLQRLATAGVQVTDYGTAGVELLGDNLDPKANDLYTAIDLSFAVIVGQLHSAMQAELKK